MPTTTSSVKSICNADLNSYCSNKVQLSRDEMKASVAYVMPRIESLLRLVQKKDARFSGQLMCVGSYFQGLKVDRPDEFDFSVPLEGIPNMIWGQGHKRYYGMDGSGDKVVSTSVPLPPPPKGYVSSIPLPNQNQKPIWNHYQDELIFQGDLIPFSVRSRLKTLFIEAVRELGFQGDMRFMRGYNGPALTLLTHGPNGYDISVDLAPIVRTELPFPDWLSWPRRDARWPSREKIQKIKATGIACVAKKNFDWLLSFVEAEKELVKNIDEDGGCRKKCHRIMKKLNNDVWCPGPKPVIASYALKNLLFWECEKYPESSFWEQDRLAERFKCLVLALCQMLEQRKLPVYFHSDVNLFENQEPGELNKALNNIRIFMNNPQKYLNC